MNEKSQKFDSRALRSVLLVMRKTTKAFKGRRLRLRNWTGCRRCRRTSTSARRRCGAVAVTMKISKRASFLSGDGRRPAQWFFVRVPLGVVRVGCDLRPNEVDKHAQHLLRKRTCSGFRLVNDPDRLNEPRRVVE